MIACCSLYHGDDYVRQVNWPSHEYYDLISGQYFTCQVGLIRWSSILLIISMMSSLYDKLTICCTSLPTQWLRVINDPLCKCHDLLSLWWFRVQVVSMSWSSLVCCDYEEWDWYWDDGFEWQVSLQFGQLIYATVNWLNDGFVWYIY